MASYGWTQKLEAPVLNGNDIEVATPGVNNMDCDPTAIEIAVDGREILAGDFTAVAGDDVVTVTNSTETVWAAGVEIYVYAPSKALTGEAAADLAATVADHETRIAALEGVTTMAASADDEDEWVDDEDADKPAKKKKGRK